MNGVYTMMNTAKVVALQMNWNGGDKQVVNETVGGFNFLTPTAHNPVAICVKASRPFPTWLTFVKMFRRYFDLGKDSGEKFAGYRKMIGGHRSILTYGRVSQ